VPAGRQEGLALLAAYRAKQRKPPTQTSSEAVATVLVVTFVTFLVGGFLGWALGGFNPDWKRKQAGDLSDPEHDPVPDRLNSHEV
jgi:hypothetical protein